MRLIVQVKKKDKSVSVHMELYAYLFAADLLKMHIVTREAKLLLQSHVGFRMYRPDPDAFQFLMSPKALKMVT